MSDPFSIVASAAGLVGFGLKTCTAVTDYLDAIKSRSQEIERAKHEVQTVHHLLTTTKNSTVKISSCHESSKSAVRACLTTCNKEIAALEALIPELQGSTAVGQDSNIWHNIRDQGKKLTYPFRRSKLDRLQAQLAKVTRTLQVALQVAGIDVVVGIENTVMAMHTSTLPSAEASALGLHQKAVLDSKVSLVTQALEKRGFEIPSPLRLDVCLINRVGRLDTLNKEFDLYQPVSMFHQNPLNTPFGANFETLFQLGFRDFEEPASPELSPLLSWLICPVYVLRFEAEIWEVNRINACIWLIDHGANLWGPISEDIPATTAHYLYASLNLLEDRILMTEAARFKAQILTRTLSTQDVRDSCHCRCSPGGCSPFVWFIRSHIDQDLSHLGPIDHGKNTIDQFPLFLWRWKPVVRVEQLRSAIRYLAFEILGIRHTCSHKYTRVDKPSADEIEELMSEDASLLELLEELVEEFDSALQSFITEEDPLGLPFWQTHWSARMTEVFGKLNDYRMDQSELLSAQRLGVMWHDLVGSPEKHQIQQDGSISQSGTGSGVQIDDVSYRESDWSVDVDDERMWRTLESLEDWRSRLDLIMSRAIPGWR
ncbi:hypothetical protein INS49_013915 [Diaporthe citri]|uniref:uncharacterized protein n=1 Tax=Diaporthe citri TaxID=83186 RepID=UPI001C7FBB01|nr:uncharacterized protein INS49_013915 [Diaporthe citri]KAG6358031.1 hypothetical protein INS49_013915 [Diaporthe citri]